MWHPNLTHITSKQELAMALSTQPLLMSSHSPAPSWVCPASPVHLNPIQMLRDCSHLFQKVSLNSSCTHSLNCMIITCYLWNKHVLSAGCVPGTEGRKRRIQQKGECADHSKQVWAQVWTMFYGGRRGKSQRRERTHIQPASRSISIIFQAKIQRGGRRISSWNNIIFLFSFSWSRKKKAFGIRKT